MKDVRGEIFKKYLLITPLTRIAQPPKTANGDALLEFAKKSKIIATSKDPLFAIQEALLDNENYTLSNQISKAVGYKQTSKFTVTFRTTPHEIRHPLWRTILIQCPEEWIKEGIGIWVDMSTAKRITDPHVLHGDNAQAEAHIYYKAPLFSKSGMKKLGDKKLKEMFKLGKEFWDRPEHRQNAWYFIDREYHRRFAYWSTEYQKYLDPLSVHANINKLAAAQHIEKREEYLRGLKELKKAMEKNGKAYWKYHYID